MFEFREARNLYHKSLNELFDALIGGTADESTIKSFGTIAGVYQVALNEENLSAYNAHRATVEAQIERQSDALGRIAKALEMRQGEL